MACVSLTSLPLVCGDVLMAGVQKLYIIANSDLTTISGATYTTATNGIINGINTVSGKTFVEVGVLKNTVGANQTGVFNENGTNYDTVELTVQLTDITPESETFVSSVRGREVSAILKSASGKYFSLGLKGGVKLSALTKGLGTADSDLIGYSLTFSGNDTLGIKLTDSAVALTKIG
ncbi:hypothetical protein [Pedobacter steynii]